MTHETKKKVMAEAFDELRKSSVTCATATIGEQVDDSWDGMMKAVAKLKTHNPTGEEFAGLLFAAMKWMHAYCEQWTNEKVRAAEELLEHEKDAEHEEALAAKRA